MADYEIFELGNVPLQSGVTLQRAKLAYKTYGTLSPARDNVIVMPTFYGGTHTETESLMGLGRPLDPARYFIIVPNMFGNGLSSSPSNTPPPLDRAAFPRVTLYDNVTCQHRLITEHFGINQIRLVVGFSMGAQQAFQWGALYPEMVQAIAPICGTAKTSPHNYLFLEGVKAALLADDAYQDGWYERPPVKGMIAFSRVYAGWVFSQDFFREQEYRKLGLASVDDATRMIEGYFRQRDTNDLLAMLATWQHADISANPIFKSDLAAALRAIRCRAIVMPCTTDLYFRVQDNRLEAAQMRHAELRPIPSIWGHIVGLGANPPDNAFIDAALSELLT
ncbi:MAG TPA: alpha/beta fold hydrolase [Candidatus Binataceae bacterium]|nr:alpha/beta fold hydrolase [Candidatus Binataceae bacterium]